MPRTSHSSKPWIKNESHESGRVEEHCSSWREILRDGYHIGIWRSGVAAGGGGCLALRTIRLDMLHRTALVTFSG